MKDNDLTIVGLAFSMLVLFGIQINLNVKINQKDKELLEAKKAVIVLDERLTTFEDMVGSLNEDNKNIIKYYQERLDRYKDIDRYIKDLERIFQ